MGFKDDIEKMRKPKKGKPQEGPSEGYDFQRIESPYPPGTIVYLEGNPFEILGFMYSPSTQRTQVLLQSVTREEAIELG